MPATNEVLHDGRYKLNHQYPVSDDGIVFDAYDTVSNTKVLVKEIFVRTNRVTTPSQQEQLKTTLANQATVLTSIHHDTLINVHDFFSETNRQFLVMEALEGRDLSDLISKEGEGFAVESVVRWADQLLDGLNYLHTFEPSIIHKNIRPDNIKLTADNRVKLLAFGLADGSDTRISTNTSRDNDADISYSPLEQVWESLDSASQRVIADSYGEQEEKVLRLPLDESSDVYSLGATLYHLLTGTKPVSALERAIEILDGNADPLPIPSSINPKVPESVSKLVLTAVQVKRSERFRSAAQMRDTLRSVFPLNDFDVKAPSPKTSTEGSRSGENPVATPASTEPMVLGDAKAAERGENAVTTVSSAPAEEPAIVLMEHENDPVTPQDDVIATVTVSADSSDPALEESEIEPFTYGSTDSGSSRSMAAVAGGVILLIIIAGGLWFALSSGSNATSQPLQRPVASQAVEQSPEPTQPEPAVQQAAVSIEEAPIEAVSEPDVPVTAGDPGATRGALKPVAGKAPKPVSSPPKEPAKKKALTVDDLIRDN